MPNSRVLDLGLRQSNTLRVSAHVFGFSLSFWNCSTCTSDLEQILFLQVLNLIFPRALVSILASCSMVQTNSTSIELSLIFCLVKYKSILKYLVLSWKMRFLDNFILLWLLYKIVVSLLSTKPNSYAHYLSTL